MGKDSWQVLISKEISLGLLYIRHLMEISLSLLTLHLLRAHVWIKWSFIIDGNPFTHLCGLCFVALYIKDVNAHTFTHLGPQRCKTVPLKMDASTYIPCHIFLSELCCVTFLFLLWWLLIQFLCCVEFRGISLCLPRLEQSAWHKLGT